MVWNVYESNGAYKVRTKWLWADGLSVVSIPKWKATQFSTTLTDSLTNAVSYLSSGKGIT